MSRKNPIHCPCCSRHSMTWDVWYDCNCFQGGRDDCENCARPPAERDAQIAANIRALGWARTPSPGMRDYLEPGWRGPPIVVPPQPAKPKCPYGAAYCETNHAAITDDGPHMCAHDDEIPF